MNFTRSIPLIIVLSTLSFYLSAQEAATKNSEKIKQKEDKKSDLKEKNQKTLALLNSRNWVLEAYQVQDRYGNTTVVDPLLNFVQVKDEISSVQLGSAGETGQNAVGGITVEGKIKSYKLKEGKKPKQVNTLRIEVYGATTSLITMSIHVSADSRATLILLSNFGGKYTFKGRIVPASESQVIKGNLSY